MSAAGNKILSIPLRATLGLSRFRLINCRSLSGSLVASHPLRIQRSLPLQEPLSIRSFSFGRSLSADFDESNYTLAKNGPPDLLPSQKPNSASKFVDDVPQPIPDGYSPDFSNGDQGPVPESAMDIFNSAVTYAGQSSDQIGYLESIGLAKSWLWPGDVCQHLLEYFHVYTGLPWWSTIIGTTVAVRVLTFPLYLKSSDMTARAAIANPIVNELTIELLKSGQLPMAEIQKRRKEVLRDHGVDTRWMLAPLFLNLFVGLGFFFGLERMTHADMPDLKTQGAYWFEDLTKKDPYLVLSVVPAIMFMILFKGGGDTGVQTMSPKMVKVFMALPFISILFTMNLPAAVLLNFTASSFVGAAQATMLKSPAFRRMAGLAPILKRNPASTESTASMRNQMQLMMEALKKAAEEETKKKRNL
ncbi:60Kd inner membrane protein-domain-containing protein [Lipomyces tetrasporus]|uniref:60Kd inner membrane protein-domain-containing protein n=1 Tax=Lipomyces tetrasporus TaxID=54092 RepID=A0AAD7VQN1_9ASCO|nr:60Kd inner membrane protein-domain-containing protein [Lipomyces tetrasporus]KAJ8097764.1 60Kd inner membrane protein-domain-containing protein [Lipomyces tetrasporus]